MLEVMRKALKGWAGKALIILFTAPFLFFGAESFFSVFNSKNAPIQVNGEPISQDAIARAIEANKEQIRQRFGENFDISLLSSEAMREGAITQLVDRELNKQYTEKNNLSISFAKLSEIIRTIPVFADDSGKFSQERFDTIAAQQGMSAKKFIELIRKDISSSQPREAIAESSFALPSEVKLIEQLKNQKRDITYLTLNLNDYLKKVEVNDQEINDYYESHSAEFMTEESVSIEYIELRLLDVKKEVHISDEQVLERFKSEQAQQSEQLERKASHILVAIDKSRTEADAFKRVNEINAKLKAGESFSELAKAYSDDKASGKLGGDLGFAGRGAYVDEFEKTLFSLEKGQISEPVLTEFGYHLIELTDIAKNNSLIFENEKDRIKESLATVAAQDLYQNKISSIEEMIFESPDLDNAASSLNLEIKASKQFTRDKGEGIANSAEVRKLAFSDEILKQKENSAVIEIANGDAVVIHLKEHFPSIKKPFENVKNVINLSLKTDKAKTLLSQEKDELITMLNAGDSANSIAEKANKDWQVKSGLTRRDTALPREVVEEAFKMPKPAEGKKSISSINLGESDVALITLTKTYDSETTLSAMQLDNLTQRSTGLSANGDWARHIATLKSEADVIYKTEDKPDISVD